MSIKTPIEIEGMRVSGRLAAKTLENLAPHVRSGVTTRALDRLCRKYIASHQARPAALGYLGFPGSVCISVNDVVCHGIPDHRRLIDRDIVNVDVAVVKNGFYSDTSRMFFVGNPTPLGRKLCRVAQSSLYRAIGLVRPGLRLHRLGAAIECVVRKHQFSVVKEYCGHGIGRNFHEKPYVFHHAVDAPGIVLRSGMTFTIEPIVNAGARFAYIQEDGWTVRTHDRSLSAQYEHTVLVTSDGCEILTVRPDDTIPSTISHV